MPPKKARKAKKASRPEVDGEKVEGESEVVAKKAKAKGRPKGKAKSKAKTKPKGRSKGSKKKKAAEGNATLSFFQKPTRDSGFDGDDDVVV